MTYLQRLAPTNAVTYKENDLQRKEMQYLF